MEPSLAEKAILSLQ